MGRKTYRKIITSPEILEKINPKNKKLAERFLKEKKTRSSKGTVDGYESDLNIFFTWNYLNNDDKFFIDLKKLELADFFGYCVDELQWGSSRFARMRSCLSSLSDHVEKFYDDDYPLFKNIILKSIEAMPKVVRREKTILSEEQINDLFNHLENDLKNPQEALLLALAIFSGARKSELLRFDIDIINPDNTAFSDLFIETSKQIKTKGRTKEGKLLYKYILKEPFMPYYTKWLEARKEILEKNNVEEHNKLFIRRDGQPAQIAAIDGWIKKWEKYLGVPIYMHSFRHYFATYLSKIGLESELIVEIFGWSSQDMLKVYNDLTAKERNWKSLDKLQAVILDDAD